MPEHSQPDPARGVFETLLVVTGRPVELDGHLARLGASLAELYGADLPGSVRELARSAAAGLRLGRLRLTAVPAGARVACASAVEALDPSLPFPPLDRGAALRSLPFAGGLGRHKWIDRSPLPADTEEVPLLLDAGEEVLEASRANVFAAHDGVLSTPPPDGRILPGVTRAAAIAVARAAGLEVRERRLGREELLDADEVFLTNALRGVESARSLDGTGLPPGGELSRAVADGLRRRWRLRSAPVGAPEPAVWQPLGPPAR